MNDELEQIGLVAVDGPEKEPGSSSASGSGEEQGADNAGTDNAGADTEGSTASSSSAGGEPGKGSDQAGDTQGVTEAYETMETYEGVPAEDFTSFREFVEPRIDAYLASQTVLLVAMFACVGAQAVQTLVVSLRGR